LLDAIYRGPIDFGGVVLSYRANKNQGSDQVYLTVLQADGSFHPVTRLRMTAGQ
jgi:branched-chain amino acid transport system substrate-binding protein